MKYWSAILATLTLLSCNTNETRIRIYEVFPRTVTLVSSTPSTVDLDLNMYIGPNSCYYFTNIATSIENNTVRVRYYAEDNSEGSTCLMTLSHFMDTLQISKPENISRIVMKLETGVDTVITVR